LAARDQTIEEAITAKKISYCTIDPTQYAGESDKRIILKSTHVYMYQVQGQLHITKRLKYGIVQKDDDFWRKYMVQQLEKFYLGALLPEIIDSRRAKIRPVSTILKKDL
jgi:hypothetical protein